MPISEALARVYASAPVAQGYVETLELSHSLFAVPDNHYLITNYYKQFTGKDEDGLTDLVYEPLPFVVTMPTSDGGGNQDLNIAISNVGQVLIGAIEDANAGPTENITATFRVYLEGGDALIQNDLIRLSITDISVGLDYVSAVARRADVLNLPFPSVVYRTDVFPGLDR